MNKYFIPELSIHSTHMHTRYIATPYNENITMFKPGYISIFPVVIDQVTFDKEETFLLSIRDAFIILSEPYKYLYVLLLKKNTNC